MPVAIAVDAVSQDVLRQHLHLSDLSGPGALRSRRVEVAAGVEFHRGENLRPE